MITIRAAPAAERARLADSLASAFSQDPVFSWVADIESGEPLGPKMRILFDAMLYARHGFEVTGEIVVGKGAPTLTGMWREPCS